MGKKFLFVLTQTALSWALLAHQASSWGQVLSKHGGSRLPPIRVADSDAFRPTVKKLNPDQLALAGYCPVSLRDKQEWVLGDPKIQWVIGNKLYLFADARSKDIFRAAVERYLPVLGEDCVVTYKNSGERVAGKLQSGLVYKQRLYFFEGSEQLGEFQANPDKFIDSDLANGGNCIVSKLEEGRTVVGLPETVASFDGLRYHFASLLHRKIFIMNPTRYAGQTYSRTNSRRLAELNSSVLPKGTNKPEVASTDISNGDKLGQSERFEEGVGEESERDTTDSGTAALGGYCPVTIQKEGTWNRGKSKFRHVYDGYVYFMAGPGELATFREHPEAFVPILGGDCAVSYVNTFTRVPGNIYHAIQTKGKLFLLSDAESKKAFAENPKLYLEADLSNSGNCVVSQKDNREEVAGKPEFETLHQGLRYRFSSAANKTKFLVNPERYAE
mgnify:CR=1 FL=1